VEAKFAGLTRGIMHQYQQTVDLSEIENIQRRQAMLEVLGRISAALGDLLKRSGIDPGDPEQALALRLNEEQAFLSEHIQLIDKFVKAGVSESTVPKNGQRLL
jgi:hypothetical protein